MYQKLLKIYITFCLFYSIKISLNGGAHKYFRSVMYTQSLLIIVIIVLVVIFLTGFVTFYGFSVLC